MWYRYIVFSVYITFLGGLDVHRDYRLCIHKVLIDYFTPVLFVLFKDIYKATHSNTWDDSEKQRKCLVDEIPTAQHDELFVKSLTQTIKQRKSETWDCHTLLNILILPSMVPKHRPSLRPHLKKILTARNDDSHVPVGKQVLSREEYHKIRTHLFDAAQSATGNSEGLDKCLARPLEPNRIKSLKTHISCLRSAYILNELNYDKVMEELKQKLAKKHEDAQHMEEEHKKLTTDLLKTKIEMEKRNEEWLKEKASYEGQIKELNIQNEKQVKHRIEFQEQIKQDSSKQKQKYECLQKRFKDQNKTYRRKFRDVKEKCGKKLKKQGLQCAQKLRQRQEMQDNLSKELVQKLEKQHERRILELKDTKNTYAKKFEELQEEVENIKAKMNEELQEKAKVTEALREEKGRHLELQKENVKLNEELLKAKAIMNHKQEAYAKNRIEQQRMHSEVLKEPKENGAKMKYQACVGNTHISRQGKIKANNH